MCCSDPPPPPDLSGMAQASEEVARIQQQTAQEQLAWAREQDTMNRETLDRVLGVQLPAMEEQYSNAKEDRERYETVFRPLEDAFIAEAQGYDTPERRAEERGRALADVNTQFDAARRNATQRLESYGVDPSMTRNSALDIGVRTAQAATMAGAATNAERRVEDVGRALRSDAVNLGRGSMSNVAQSYAGAVGAGNSAVSGGNATTMAGAGAAGSALGFSGQALAGYGQSANIMTQGYGNSMQAYNAKQAQTAGMLQGVGGIAGMALGFGADGGMAIDPSGMIDTGPTDGSGIDDQVNANLSVGEYVIPADVVRIKGEEFFDKLVEKYHTPAAQQRGAI